MSLICIAHFSLSSFISVALEVIDSSDEILLINITYGSHYTYDMLASSQRCVPPENILCHKFQHFKLNCSHVLYCSINTQEQSFQRKHYFTRTLPSDSISFLNHNFLTSIVVMFYRILSSLGFSIRNRDLLAFIQH